MENRQSQLRFGGPVNLIIAVLGFFLVFYLFSLLMRMLWWLALVLMPVLLIATFFINKSVITNYVGSIGRLFKRNKVGGLVAGGLSIIGLPFVSVFLFGKAMLYKKMDEINNQQQNGGNRGNNKFDDYIEYEEIDTSFSKLLNERPEPKTKTPIEIRTIKTEKPPKKDDNPYDSLWQ